MHKIFDAINAENKFPTISGIYIMTTLSEFPLERFSELRRQFGERPCIAKLAQFDPQFPIWAAVKVPVLRSSLIRAMVAWRTRGGRPRCLGACSRLATLDAVGLEDALVANTGASTASHHEL